MANNGNGGGGGGHGLGALLKPNSNLSGKDLRRAARALTRMQMLPQIHAFQHLVQGLQGQEQTDVRGLRHLGRQTTHQVSRTYRGANAANVHAQARQQALTGFVNHGLDQTLGNVANRETQAQSGELGMQLQSLGMRDAPGGGIAQQQLASMVASHQDQMSAEQSAQAAMSAGTSKGYGGLLANQALATRAQGAASKVQIRQDIGARIGAERAQAQQDINTAEGKLADTRALKGSTLIQNIMTLRKQEQDYLLGKKATQATLRGQSLSAATARRGQDISSATSRFDATHGGSSGSSGGTGGHAKQHQINQITTLANQAIRKKGLPGGSGHGSYSFDDLAHYLLQQEGISNASLVNRVLHNIVHRKRHHGGGGGGGGPYSGASPGIG